MLPLRRYGVSIPDLTGQLRRIAPVLAGVSLLMLLVVLVLVYLRYGTSVDPLVLHMESVPKFGLPPYTGLYIKIGFLLWSASAAVYLLCGALLWNEPTAPHLSRFFVLMGLVSSVWCLDDMFFLHEEVERRLAWVLDTSSDSYRHAVMQAPVFLAYAAPCLFILLRYWPAVRDTEFMLLVAAAASLSTSVGSDVAVHLFEAGIPEDLLIIANVGEDLLKLLGIVLWLVYAARTGYQAVWLGLRGTQ